MPITHQNGEGIHDSLDSYRGQKNEQSIDFDRRYEPKPVTAEQLMHLIEESAERKIGFVGYKGGVFEMSWNTFVWASEYDKASGKGICGVSDDGVLLTFEAQDYWDDVWNRWWAKVKKPMQK